MVRAHDRHIRLMAIDPCTRGFGFAVLEDGTRLLDWGVARVWGIGEDAFLTRLDALVSRYALRGLVIEELMEGRHSPRRTAWSKACVGYASEQRLELRALGRPAIRQAFSDLGRTKQEIANAIADAFPELAPQLPRFRKPWMSEDERMNVFDAVALLVALGR